MNVNSDEHLTPLDIFDSLNTSKTFLHCFYTIISLSNQKVNIYIKVRSITSDRDKETKNQLEATWTYRDCPSQLNIYQIHAHATNTTYTTP